VIWSGLPRIEEQPVALRAAMGTVVVGGFARLRSWRQTGRPRPIFIAGIVLELIIVPGLWVWLQRVARAAGARA
jgi:hypothetical protein